MGSAHELLIVTNDPVVLPINNSCRGIAMLDQIAHVGQHRPCKVRVALAIRITVFYEL